MTMASRTLLPSATKAQPHLTSVAGAVLQRKCACGNHTIAGGECEGCSKKKRLGLQTKLKVNEPGDINEREADRIGEQVMRISEPAHLQRQCAYGGMTNQVGECARCEKKRLNLQSRATNQAEPATVPSIVHEVLRSPGQPLDAGTLAYMEPRFGRDFSRVRVHTDARAAESARAVSALAYTVEPDVVFGAGQFAPDTNVGQQLLAHELTHVVQQGGTSESRHSSHPAFVQRQAAPSVRKPPFDDQPVALRNVLEASFAVGKFGCRRGRDAADCFNLLDVGARIVLNSIYQRLSRFGLWGHVLYVGGIWTSGVGGAHFTVKDHVSFFSDLLASARFCTDTALGKLLHRGTTSVREISTGDSLHLSLSTSNSVSAHIDAISPVEGIEKGGLCRYHPVRAATHIGREAFPEITKIPGLLIFPEPQPTLGLPERAAPPPEFIRLELRF